MNEFTSLNESLSSNASSISRLLKKYNQAIEDIDKEIADIAQRYDGIIPKSAVFRKGQLEILKAKILNHIIKLGNLTTSETTKKALDGFEQGYYRTAYTIDKKSGFNIDFNMLNTTITDSVLMEKFESKTFSERIWDNTAKLAVKAEQAVNKAVADGESTEKLSRKLKKEFGSGFYEASRVMNTEIARAVTAGQMQAYKNSGVVKWVMWDAALESNTCKHCGDLDGTKYEIDDAPYLPEHPNCRCCLIPIVDDWKPSKKLDNESKEIIDYKNYNEWYDNKINKAVANSGESGIIKSGSDSMGLSIEIDKFTPCLVDRITGEIIDTNYSIVKKSELKSLKKKGWNFNWLAEDLSDATIYKLTLKNDDEIQGLIAVTDYPKDKALYINLAESAPSNIGLNKKYEGVGGHLFAIAAQVSLLKGYGGFLFLDAKNTELVEYYSQKFGAILLGMPHPYRMFIDEENAQKLLKIYTLEGV